MSPLRMLYTQPELPESEEELAPIPPDVWRKPFQEEPTPGGRGIPGFDTGLPPGVAARRAYYSQYPPHRTEPPDAFILDFPLNRIPVVVAAGGSVVFAFPPVPLGRLGVCKRIGAVVTAGALADVRWTTRKNLSPIPPFPGVRGAIGSLELPQETQALLAPGDTFDLLAENTGLAAVTVGARLYGWWWTDDKA